MSSGCFGETVGDGGCEGKRLQSQGNLRYASGTGLDGDMHKMELMLP